jgi:REP element-mobilizing transposase RayT
MSERWVHLMWSTYGAWLHGDPRGFRDRFHRIHSSGDYRSPPPPGEHAGLREHVRRIMHKDPVLLGPSLRARALRAILEKAARERLLVVCAAVSATHVHVLARLDPLSIAASIGKLKRHSSHAIRDAIPGQVWGARRHVRAIRDRAHQLEAFRYILRHARSEGAAVWRIGQA